MRSFATLALVLSLLLPLSFAASPAQAQDTPHNSTTLTEPFLNAKLLAVRRSDARIIDTTVDFQPGKIVLEGIVEADRQPLELALTLIPRVNNGRLTFEITTLTIGRRTIDLTEDDHYGTADTITDLHDVIAGAVPSNRLESVTVTDDDLTITWLRADPEAPALALVDNTLTMTATETYFNTLPDMTNPSNPAFDSFSIDFRPGQAVLTTTYMESDGTRYPVEIAYVPTVYEGLSIWSVQAMIVGSNRFDAVAIGQINDDIVRSWRMFFAGLYRTGHLVSVELTDETISLTWDADLQTPIPFDPAQGSVVVPEAAINGALRVTSPAAYTISNVVVDLRPGQALLSAHLNLPNGRIYIEEITFIPSLNNGVIEWTVASAAVNGNPVDSVTLARFNETMTQAWNAILWRNMSVYRITSITIDDTEIRLTVRSR